LTGDRGLLLQAVGQFIGRKVMSPGIAGLGQAGTPEAVSPEAAGPERINNARAALQTLTDLARFLGRIRDRRKALVYVSEGVDYGFGSVPEIKATASDQQGSLGFVHQQDASREVRDRLREFVEAANRANVTLYAFDPRVYTQGGDEFVDIASGQPDDMTIDESKNVRTTKLMDDLEASQDNLRVLASETGGFAVTGSPKALQNAFERVRNETSNYYIIGYYPSNDARDGKFRKIEVRVKRPGLRVAGTGLRRLGEGGADLLLVLGLHPREHGRDVVAVERRPGRRDDGAVEGVAVGPAQGRDGGEECGEEEGTRLHRMTSLVWG
jgi:VWFA-related protein